MKTLLAIILFLITLNIFAQAPITIMTSDMPSSGDTVRFSVAANIMTFDSTQTGANFTWDFSSLMPVSQYVDTFIPPSSTNLVYLAVFFGADMAATVPFSQNIGTVNLSNIFNFYNKTTTKFELMGFGAEMNGIPVPVVFSSKDVIYQFPLDYGDMDSSNSAFTFNLPTFGTIHRKQKRVNQVDGWGTLTTPKGTYQVLRVKSKLYIHDSISSSLGNIVLDTYNAEYKWLAKNMDEPVLQINTTTFAGNTVVSQVSYQDHYQQLSVTDHVENWNISVYPNPAKQKIHLEIYSAKAGEAAVELFDMHGKNILQQKIQLTQGTNSIILMEEISKGVYFLKIAGEKGETVEKVVVQ